MQSRQPAGGDEVPLVSENDLRLLRSYLEHVELDNERLDALGNIWLEASREERPLIASCYPQYFTNPQFVSKLSSKGCARLTQAGASTTSRSAVRHISCISRPWRLANSRIPAMSAYWA